MIYTDLTETELPVIAGMYMDYNNAQEGGCWSLEKAVRRIRQIVRMEDSLCLIQHGENGEITGFVIGYYKQYDDLLAYYLEEIVIFGDYQNMGCGSHFLAHIEKIIRENGASHMELLSVNDAHHMHFYRKAGFCGATSLTLMGKHFL